MDAIERDCDNCKHYEQGYMSLRCTECVVLCPRDANLPNFEPKENLMHGNAVRDDHKADYRPAKPITPHDPVNHPSHYTQGKIEVIDFIRDQKLNYCEGNIVKYVCRHKFKNGLEDLRKARQYVDFLIEQAMAEGSN